MRKAKTDPENKKPIKKRKVEEDVFKIPFPPRTSAIPSRRFSLAVSNEAKARTSFLEFQSLTFRERKNQAAVFTYDLGNIKGIYRKFSGGSYSEEIIHIA
ncbi:unnamed protein product [Acanthoscelides obtectus]|uniref:Uncharacterized protein n=1 Tax=Acanthoscelides obtectus TaxID=200917 RepID=A0A9P0QBK6_ACAOB|nr:unnamed protein product [Acanthoscelides obtectus]CAK1685472.1 hypothetical protein AOBTE_LOCUS35435 [Acanthoscelides obtectus]